MGWAGSDRGMFMSSVYLGHSYIDHSQCVWLFLFPALYSLLQKVRLVSVYPKLSICFSLLISLDISPGMTC